MKVKCLPHSFVLAVVNGKPVIEGRNVSQEVDYTNPICVILYDSKNGDSTSMTFEKSPYGEGFDFHIGKAFYVQSVIEVRHK